VRKRVITGLLVAAASLLGPAAAYADMFRCVGADGNALFTNIACPSNTQASTIVKSAATCTTESCQNRRDHDLQEAAERLRAEQEQLAVYAEERRKREQEEPDLEAFDPSHGITPGATAGYDPLDGTAYPVYPIIGVPLTCGHHCAAPSHYWHRGTERSDQHHRQHWMGEPGRGRHEGGPSDWDSHHPMRDTKEWHEDPAAKHDRHDPRAQPGDKHDPRWAEGKEPSGARQQKSSLQVDGPR